MLTIDKMSSHVTQAPAHYPTYSGTLYPSRDAVHSKAASCSSIDTFALLLPSVTTNP